LRSGVAPAAAHSYRLGGGLARVRGADGAPAVSARGDRLAAGESIPTVIGRVRPGDPEWWARPCHMIGVASRAMTANFVTNLSDRPGSGFALTRAPE
jgi:hypothetical protein